MSRLNSESLLKILKKIQHRKWLAPDSREMVLVTTVGALHGALRELHDADPDKRTYTKSKVPRSNYPGTKGNNAYPLETKQEILARLPYCVNKAALAREFGVAPRTVARWAREQKATNKGE